MEHTYEFKTIRELAEMALKMPLDTQIAFTLDEVGTLDFEQGDEPTGWYGITRINPFDEYNADVILLGYYGGIHTELHIVDYEDAKELQLDELEKFIKTYFLAAPDSIGETGTVCVDMKWKGGE